MKVIVYERGVFSSDSPGRGFDHFHGFVPIGSIEPSNDAARKILCSKNKHRATVRCEICQKPGTPAYYANRMDGKPTWISEEAVIDLECLESHGGLLIGIASPGTSRLFDNFKEDENLLYQNEILSIEEVIDKRMMHISDVMAYSNQRLTAEAQRLSELFHGNARRLLEKPTTQSLRDQIKGRDTSYPFVQTYDLGKEDK